MRGGWIGRTAVLSLLLFAAAARGEEELLYLDGVLVNLESSTVRDEEGLLVPLREFGCLVGVEVSEIADGTLSLRWREGRRDIQVGGLPVIEGRVYVSLDWLVALAGGDLRRVGSATHVDLQPSLMSELDVSEERVVLRFDGFVPVEVVAVDQDSLHLRFHHCDASVSQRSVVLAVGPMTRVEARSMASGGVDLFVSLREIGALRVKRFETVGFYAVTIEVGAEAITESVTQIGGDVELHEIETILEAGWTRMTYVRVEGWRTRYRVRPAYDLSAPGSATSLSQIVREDAAEAGLGVGSEMGLLVVDGVPLSLPTEDVLVLGIDAFGRPSAFRATGSAVLRVEGVCVPIDGVNRPVRYGEAIAYPPGYCGEISQGVPGSFTVLKLRSDQVVSVYQGAFVDRDPTATLIVGSGEASARFVPVSIGDDARLECHTEDGVEPLKNAITIDSVLVHDGLDVAAEQLGERARSWNLLATDWHGALILLSIPRHERSAGATADEVRSFLRTLAVPVQDAFVLGSGGASSLVVRDHGYLELGDASRVAVALLLISIAE
jgi:hypothetical protein